MKRLILVMIITIFSVGQGWADNNTVYFIGTNNHSLTNAHVSEYFDVVIEEYNLDGHKNLEQMLSNNLPQNIDEAKFEANRRLENLDPASIKNSFKGIAAAVQFDLKKAPAFVFNEGRSVIYGITDAENALKRWTYYKSRSGAE